MPKLDKNLSACGVNGVGDFPPSIHLDVGIDAGRLDIPLSLAGNLRAFGDQKPGGSPLAIVLGDKVVSGVRAPVGPIAGQRSHHDAIGQLQIAEAKWREKNGRFKAHKAAIPIEAKTYIL